MAFTLELLSEEQVNALKRVASLLQYMELQDGVLVNYYSFLLHGYNVEPWDAVPHIDVVVVTEHLPWVTKGEKVREVIPPKDTRYFGAWKEYVATHQRKYPLHLIPEPLDIVETLGVEYTFPTGERLVVCKPVENVKGFKKAIDNYSKRVLDLRQAQFDPIEINRWERKINSIRAAVGKNDEDLLSACDISLRALGKLYRVNEFF
jgi:hypothetical protein